MRFFGEVKGDFTWHPKKLPVESSSVGGVVVVVAVEEEQGLIRCRTRCFAEGTFPPLAQHNLAVYQA